MIEIASEARIDREIKTVTAAFPESYAPLVAAMSYGDGKLTLELGSAGAFAFDVAAKAGYVGFSRQNELFRSYNPNFKRACYGPFNVYTSTMRTYKESEMYGFETGDTLSDAIYTGFAQFEDYPASCAYQTYRGAFGAGTTLTNAPRLTIYPEQYTTSRGGIIDGAVYFAHPPIGAYRVPLWFNTTHAREYVYNTPTKPPDGFRYWGTYGFMNADFSPEETEAFVRD